MAKTSNNAPFGSSTRFRSAVDMLSKRKGTAPEKSLRAFAGATKRMKATNLPPASRGKKGGY